MTKRLVAILALGASMAFVMACSDDDGDPPGTDTIITIPEGGLADGGPGEGTLPPDGNGAGSFTCRQIFECQQACDSTDAACLNNCITQGSTQGQGDYTALDQCLNAATTGAACSASCANVQSQECLTCATQQCPTQMSACGLAVPGDKTYGQACSETNGCAAPLVCMFMQQGDTQGYCSRTCTGDVDCAADAPADSNPLCVLETTAAFKVCGFVCNDQTTTFDCPPELTCGNLQLQSGQIVCQP